MIFPAVHRADRLFGCDRHLRTLIELSNSPPPSIPVLTFAPGRGKETLLPPTPPGRTAAAAAFDRR
jgi:hypothetical protein